MTKKDRIDALGPTDRLPLFRGNALREDQDPVLQALVEEAAEQLDAPIALVSLVLDDVQYFRAFRGLPPDLEASRSTPRDVSFCQFVVRDGQTFAVENAPEDARVPQDLVKRYGIASYLGVPIELSGERAGSMCVIDTEARSFSADANAALAAIAARVSARLNEVATLPGDTVQAPRALDALAMSLQAQVAAVELRVAALPGLDAAERASLLEELGATRQIGDAIAAATASGRDPAQRLPLEEIIALAADASRTAFRGRALEVTGAPVGSLLVETHVPLAVAVLSVAMACASQQTAEDEPLRLQVASGPGEVSVLVSAPAGTAAPWPIDLEVLVFDAPLDVRQQEDGVQLCFRPVVS